MAKDWAPLRDDVRDLYHIKNMPLKEVMRLIRGRHDFVASERTYRSQLKKWGFMKNNTQANPYQRPRPAARRAQVSQPRTIRTTSAAAAQGLNALHGNIEVAIIEEGLANHRDMAAVGTEYDVFDQSLDPGIEYLPFASTHQDPEGKTPLHHAVINKDLEQVRDLLSAGAAVNIKDFTGSGPLHYGVLTANLELVQLLLRYGAEVDAKGPMGRTPLHQAVSMDDVKITGTLLANGGMVSEPDDNGDSPLHAASRLAYNNTAGVPPLITMLLQSGADVNMVNKNGSSAFHTFLDQPFAVSSGRSPDTRRSILTATILTLFDHNANVKAPLPDGRTPLHIFLDRSGFGWTKKKRRVPWWSRVSHEENEAQIMEHFLDKCDPSGCSMPCGESIAHYYIRDVWHHPITDSSWAKRLCQLAEPHQLPSNGNSLLHELMLTPQAATESLVSDLLRRGWDPTHRNNRGDTPLHLLLQVRETVANRPVIEKLLLTTSISKAGLWICNSEGITLLSQAATRFMKKKNPGIVRALLRLDIDRETFSTDAWAAWESARRAATFSEAQQHIDVDATSLPLGLDDHVRKEAYAVLAEKHLDLIKEKLSNDEPVDKRQHRAAMADILKSCRARDVVIDMRYYDELLALC